ncbi:MAG: tetratricopeptide repeat protein [Chloroflexota bacterium]
MKKALLTALFLALTFASGCAVFNLEPTPTATPSPTASPLDSYQTGLDLLSGNEFAAAGDAFQTAIEIDPSFGPSYSGLALSQLWEGEQLDEMLPNAVKGAELVPEDAYARSVLAYAQLSSHQLGDAAANAEFAYQLDPGDPFVQMVTGLAFVGNYEYERAWEILTAAYPQNPESPEIYYALGAYFAAADDFGHALAAYQEAIGLDPEFVIWQLGLAQFYFNAERYDETNALLESIEALNPAYLPAEILAIQTALMRHDLLAAEERVALVTERFPESAAAGKLQAYLAIYQEDYPAALELLSQAKELAADPYSASWTIGSIYLEQETCDQAARVYTELLSEYPGVVGPIIGSGRAGLCSDDLDSASQDFLEALRIDPFSEDAYLGLAEVYLSQEEWQLAQDSIDAAMAIEKSVASAHLAQAKLLFLSGDPGAAEAELHLALELNPYSQTGYNMLAGLLLAHFHVADGVEAVEQAAELNPDASKTQALQGMLYYLSGKQDGTVELLDQAIAADPQNPGLHLFRALSLRDDEMFSEAASSVDTFISLLEDQDADQVRISQAKRLYQVLEDDGYQISQEQALQMIQDDLSFELEKVPGMYFGEYQDQGFGLIVDLLIRPTQIADEDYLYDLVTIANVAAGYLPRVDPEVDAGLVIEVNLGSRDLFVAQLSIFEMKNFADTLIGPETLLDQISFDLADSTIHRGSIEKIIMDVAELRDLDVLQIPEYEIISQEEVRAYMLEDVDEEIAYETEQDYQPQTLLGVIPDEADVGDLMLGHLGTNIAGLYTPREEKIYVISNGRLTSYDQITLAHECEHAIADQYFGLNLIQSRATDDDRDLAALSLVEGDATLLSVHYLNAIIPDLGWWAAGSPNAENEPSEVRELPGYISNMSSFPYTYGRKFVDYLHNIDGWDEVNRAFRDPPISSEQIIHPEKYLAGDRPQRVYLDDISSVLGERWELTDENVIGEYGIFLTMTEYFGETAAQQAAEGWGGDRYILLEKNRSYEKVLVWKTVWDDSLEAEEFFNSLITAMFHRYEYHELVNDFVVEPDRRIWQSEDDYLVMVIDGDQVTIVIGSELDQLELILDVLE